MIKKLLLTFLFAFGIHTHGMESEEGLLGRKRNLTPLKNADIVKMDLSNDPTLTNIDFIKNFPALTELDLRNSSNLGDNYKPVSQLSNLKKLNLFCIGLNKVKYIKNLKNLISLTIICPDVDKAMKYIVALDNLEFLSIGGGNIEGFKKISTMTHLRSLTISHIDSEECKEEFFSLDFISPLINLERLTLAGNDQIASIKPLIKLPNLKYLNLTGCCAIQDLIKLKKMQSIEILNLRLFRYSHSSCLDEDIKEIEKIPTLKKIIR